MLNSTICVVKFRTYNNHVTLTMYFDLDQALPWLGTAASPLSQSHFVNNLICRNQTTDLFAKPPALNASDKLNAMNVSC